MTPVRQGRAGDQKYICQPICSERVEWGARTSFLISQEQW